MNGISRNILSLTGATTLSGSARLTNFNPDRILFVLKGASVVTKADLAKIVCTMNFKNSVGSGISITNNLPLDFVANLNDYLYGFGLLGSDKTAAFVLDIGKYILKADDEITFALNTTATLSQALSVDMFALSTFIGKEKLISYAYVNAQATQAYQQANVCDVYAQITSESNSVYITVDDFFGSNNVSELAVCGIGASLGSSEDYDGFGLVFHDETGLTQPVTVRAGSSNEMFLFKIWNFDRNRIGFAQTDASNAQMLAENIQRTNADKARCLEYYYRG